MLSSVLIILVSGTFLVQNRYYSRQQLNVGVHDNARVATERLASEIRTTMNGGFIVAGPRTLSIRSPVSLAGVCDRVGNDIRVHIEGGVANLDTDEIVGVALLDPASGAWRYEYASWSSLDGGSAGAASGCAGNGADTVSGMVEFVSLLNVGTLVGSPPNPGDLLMLFRQTTFRIRPSALDTLTLGLFRETYGRSPVEFATGMDSTAQFQYRTGGASYADTVIGSSVGDIDAVRIVAAARLPARSGIDEDATFGWAVNVTVRNLP